MLWIRSRSLSYVVRLDGMLFLLSLILACLLFSIETDTM